jgi:hypothetical protein
LSDSSNPWKGDQHGSQSIQPREPADFCPHNVLPFSHLTPLNLTLFLLQYPLVQISILD